jgi:hypothetical protein
MTPIINQIIDVATDLDEAISNHPLPDRPEEYQLLMRAQAAVATLSLLAATMTTESKQPNK